MLKNPPKVKAALEIIRDDKTVSKDLQEVLDKGYKDISGLLSGLHDNPELAFDQEFYERVLEKKKRV